MDQKTKIKQKTDDLVGAAAQESLFMSTGGLLLAKTQGALEAVCNIVHLHKLPTL